MFKKQPANAKKENVSNPEAAGKDSNSEIFMVRVYQAVTFEKSSLTTFYSNHKGKKVDIRLIPEMNMVEFKTEKDHILVPYPNISCVYLNSKIRQENTKAVLDNLNAKSSINPSDISRPR